MYCIKERNRSDERGQKNSQSSPHVFYTTTTTMSATSNQVCYRSDIVGARAPPVTSPELLPACRIQSTINGEYKDKREREKIYFSFLPSVVCLLSASLFCIYLSNSLAGTGLSLSLFKEVETFAHVLLYYFCGGLKRNYAASYIAFVQSRQKII